MKINTSSQFGYIKYLFLGIIVIPCVIWGAGVLLSAETFVQLFTENKQLKSALTHLTQERQIGYAKVIQQNIIDGEQWTELTFVETAPDDLHKKILEKTYRIKGDVIHFDALIVRFNQKMLLDQGQTSLYLWRRVYSDSMPPAEGFSIEIEGQEPKRYQGLLAQQTWLDKLLLKPDNKQRFWQAIWSLSQQPDKLTSFGISAIYGSAIYQQLRPGLIYIFKINANGQIYPETVPDL